MATKIIMTKYPELVRFLFTKLRYETQFPIRDNFFLIKQLTHQEHRQLERFTNYVIISKTYATEEWGRQEIFDYCKLVRKSRRKPSFLLMDDKEFSENIKAFWITGKWNTEDIETGMFNLYKGITSKTARWEEYFKMRELGVHPMAIFYSLLTFVGKVHDSDGDMSGIKKGYASVLKSKRNVIEKTFKTAIENYTVFDDEVDPDIKVMRFLMDIGGGYERGF